jgi:hypothetical protein
MNSLRNLCASCCKEYPVCDAFIDDTQFGDGMFGDNVMACKKYEPEQEVPECYDASDAAYPLCKGANTPQGIAENDCQSCSLYEEYSGDDSPYEE